MARGKTSLLSQIQGDALDEGISISTALRKSLILGGESGSSQLREWARRELEGYGQEDELPSYRSIRAPLMVDGISGFYQVTHQQIPASAIPDFARDSVSENLELRYAVRNLEAMLEHAELRLQPPGASDLAKYMNMTAGTQIVSLYWSVSQTEIHGVLDQIRTALIQLVVELRSHMEDEDAIPTAESANQAVNVVITGERSSVQITTAQASGTNPSATATATMNDPELVPLLNKLESLLRAQGDGEGAEKVAHLATLVETPERNQSKIRRLWDAIKLAATTNEAVTLVGRITPLLLASGAHHH